MKNSTIYIIMRIHANIAKRKKKKRKKACISNKTESQNLNQFLFSRNLDLGKTFDAPLAKCVHFSQADIN